MTHQHDWESSRRKCFSHGTVPANDAIPAPQEQEDAPTADFESENIMKFFSSSAVSTQSRAGYVACSSADSIDDLFGRRSIEE